MMHPSSEKLSHIRTLMLKNEIDAYIIPDTDPHLGEYVPDHWRLIEWLTGFTGSAGTVVITEAFAGLWTDSRYLVQAAKQLKGSGFELIEPVSTVGNGPISWLADNLDRGSRIGLDGRTFSISRCRKLEKSTEGKSISIDIECDLITALWSDRPSLPDSAAFDHSVTFSGRDRGLKIRDVRDEMMRLGVDYHLLASPDDIMWLLNIRGRDVKYSPLLMSFAIIGQEQILLFVREDKIPLSIAKEFDRSGIVMLPYEEVAGMLTTLTDGSEILISPSATSASLYHSVPGKMKIKEDVSIPSRLKAIKNNVEIANIDRIMIRDGVALTRFFHWIEQNAGSVEMSELSLTEKLYQLRSEQENFLSLSFSTIVAYNEHAALPHYSATQATNSVIGQCGLLLVDSGSQYLDGTTDITRTIALGNATARQKRDFTLVLKGMISLAMAAFPTETAGYQLDILARRALWENGLNYGHGTGHGVGFCLNVHEGPQRISPVAGGDPDNYIRPGMLVSDEPAVYRPGDYGIRTENLLLCYEDEETEFGRFLRFNTVSLCYIDRSLIEISLLDPDEIKWLNEYHAQVYEKLSPHLAAEEREWLKIKCSGVLRSD